MVGGLEGVLASKIGSMGHGTGLGGLMFPCWELFVHCFGWDTRGQRYGLGIVQRTSLSALVVANV